MKNIFIVKSPLQLINALEAKFYFELDSIDCVLIVLGDKKNYSQILKLIHDQDQWKTVIVLDKISVLINNTMIDEFSKLNSKNMRLSEFQKSSVFLLMKLHKLAKIYKHVDFLFAGDNYNEMIRGFINSISYNKVILLDDGVSAIYIAEIRRNNHKSMPNLAIKKRIKICIRKFFQGLDDRQADKVCFFSAYNLDIDVRDELISNKYRYLQKEINNIKHINSVYFLGSPLSETGLMSEYDYFNQVKMIREKYSDYDFVYVAHRRESVEKTRLIEESMNVEICHFEYPIEYQLVTIGPIPRLVVSFVSSALENLRVIMGENLDVVSYKLLEGTYNKESRVNEVYKYFSQNVGDHFHLLSLDGK